METPGQILAPAQMHRALHYLTKLRDLADTEDPDIDRSLERLSALIKDPISGRKAVSSLGSSDVTVIGQYGFCGGRPERRHLALRCLNNAMVQAPPITEMSVEGSLPAKATELVRSADADDQFLAARLLLLCAAHPTVDFPSDFELETLAQALNAATARHASTGETEPTKACTAILQLISVLAAKHEAAAHHLLVSLDPVLRMFDRAPIRDPPLQPPMSLLIDCLAALVSHDDPLATSEISWPPFNEEKLVNVLALAIQAYQPDSVERQITPLASLLFKISRSAPSDTKERLRAHLLPSDQDRTQALGRGHSLPHKLVKISTEAVSSVLKEVMAHLFLELSDGDPKRLVHNVGFGCAVGLLYTLGIPAPPDDSDGSQSAGHPCEINPVTGQRRDMETQPSLPEMTDAEKEREAERLVRLV